MLFASDLDNTLIHSYKAAGPQDICVEVKSGKQLSFMAAEAFLLLKEINKRCVFVPVTTRSIEQYLRIDLGVSPRYAVAAHGAVLLVDGKIDEQWIYETRQMLNVNLPKFSENEFIFDVRDVDGFFTAAKSKSPQDAVAYLHSVVDTRQFKICAVYNKVYVLPNGLDKGLALERLRKRLRPKTVICAGDSLFDIPMLSIADTAIIPGTLKWRNENALILDADSFALSMLRAVKKAASIQDL